ncbi:hypothetical protein DesfrDRAFT_0830 [Solidesulfovibrio fructosivorans JJ]]|uniref:Uncharacterized protein n=1 Tax=Solidesulfovibrio fructosivorans JJ] TaxID=596151 RepID=E1JT81_SOLFR|nr:hypothetical protein [Solidesulfovibrio fructosivorans]EFL52341.1 hypothetical protein DesfrDRAFT_0830 [Solidesulfovibrio fructosivorans JJ]]
MSLKIIFLLCFSLCIPVFVILLYIYSAYTNKNDLELKEMLAEANSAGRNIDEVFILEKSYAAICFMCIMPLFSVGFMSALLFFDHGFWKMFMYVSALIAFMIGSVSAFCDYFLSMIVISKCRMYVRCLKTLYRPVVVALDGRYRYEAIHAGMFGLYMTRYTVSISMPSGSYVVINVNNKKQLRDVLNRTNSTSGVAEVEGAVPI